MADQIIDACCLINIFSSGKAEPILGAYDGRWHVSQQVRNESLSIRQSDKNDTTKLASVPLDFSGAISTGLIKECRLEGRAEYESYVQFAAQLDDGEASCLAIAGSRGWLVATDDRKAIRLAAASGIAIVTTPEIVKHWVDEAEPTAAEIAEVLQAMERFAKYVPHRSNSMREWWMARRDPS